MYVSAGVVAVVLALSNMPTPFYVQWKADIGFASSILTLLFSAYIVALLLSLAFSGGLVTRFGSRRVIFAGLLMAMAASGFFMIARSESALLIARAGSGLAVGAVIAAGVPWIIDLGGSARRKTALSLASGAVAAGAGAGPILAGAATLFAKNSVSAAFACELAMLVGAFAAVLILRPPSDVPPGSAARVSLLPRIARSEVPYVVQGVACYGCALGATAFVLSLGPSVLRDIAGIDAPLVAGAMASSMFLTGALVQLPGSRLSTTGMFGSAGIATVAAAGAIALSVLLRHPAPLIAGAILAGVGYGVAQLAGLTVIADGVAAERRASANALLNIGGYVPCGLLPLITGVLVDVRGLAQGTLLFAALIASITIATTLLIVRNRFK